MPQDAQGKKGWEANPPRDWGEEQACRVALEVRRLRKGRGAAQWLANRTRELGFEVSRSVISDLEVGRRRYVTVAELIILARALDTAPIALLYPHPYYREGRIAVLPTPEEREPRELEKIVAVQWFSGVAGLYLYDLGLSDVDQMNYGSQLQGLKRARVVFALRDKLAEEEGLYRALIDQADRKGRSPELDDKIDKADAEMRYLRGRIDEELTLGARDLTAESYDEMFGQSDGR